MNLEVYTDRRILELETLAPLKVLEAGRFSDTQGTLAPIPGCSCMLVRARCAEARRTDYEKAFGGPSTIRLSMACRRAAFPSAAFAVEDLDFCADRRASWSASSS